MNENFLKNLATLANEYDLSIGRNGMGNWTISTEIDQDDKSYWLFGTGETIPDAMNDMILKLCAAGGGVMDFGDKQIGSDEAKKMIEFLGGAK